MGGRFLTGAASLLLVPGWLGLAGAWHWTLDLLAHFRWQYLILALLILPWALWRRRRVLAVAALATLLLNAVLIGRLAWEPDLRAAALAPDFHLRVLSTNVRTSNTDQEAVIATALAADADVALFIEVDARWAQALRVLESRYPFRLEHPQPDNFGIAMYSRVPIEDARLLHLGRARRPTIAATLIHAGRRFAFIGTHPVPPMNRHMAAARDEQFALLAGHVAAAAMPVIVVGDFNASPWSAGMRTLTAGALGFRGLDPPWTPTWSVRTPFAIPIDHALCTAPLVITRRAVGGEVGSDHRPIVVEFGWIE